MATSPPTDSAIFAAANTLPGVEFLRASYARQQFAPHAHGEYGFGIVLAGLERFRYRGVEHMAGPGTVIAMAPEAVHTGGPGAEGGWTYEMVYVPAATLLPLVPGPSPVFTAPVIHDRALVAAFAFLARACIGADTRLAAQSALGLTLASLVSRHASNAAEDAVPSAPAAILEARERLEGIADGDHDDPSLVDLAEGTGLSPTRFLRLYTARHGLPPHAHLRDMRLRRARYYLRDGMGPADAAAAAGFADQSHLTRWFKRATGTTPAAYARAVAAQ